MNKRGKPLTRPARLRALGSRRPKFRFGFGVPFARDDELRVVLPFRRSWIAIGVLGVVFALFCVPLITVGAQLSAPRDGDLFSLVFTLFHGFWVLGWFVGVAALGLVLAALLLGREVLIVRRRHFVLRLEVLGLGVAGEFDVAGMRNLRTAAASAKGGTAWRGAHLAFDYFGVPVEFGSGIAGQAADDLLKRVRGALGVGVPDGPAPALESALEPGPDAAPPATPRVAGRDPGDHGEHRRPVATPAAPLSWRSPSTVALIAANVLPLAGVFLLGWSMGEIMLLYWAESAIVGVFNLLRMAVVGRWTILFLGPFFVGHYGAFMAVHLLFLYAFFIQDPYGGARIATSAVLADLVHLWPALAALAVSHALSYRLNFIGRAEYVGRTAGEQMGEPYRRIVVMHVAIIFGGFLALLLGSPLPALVLLIVLKIAADVRAHLREHGATPQDG